MFFIDFEAFQIVKGGDFILKELAIVSIDNPLKPLYCLFRPPYTWDNLTEDQKKQCQYVTRNIHHLEWYEGVIRFCGSCIQYNIMDAFEFATNSTFYAMGKQKCKFLQDMFPYLKIIEYIVRYENLPIIPPHIKCLTREHGDHCALKKAYRLYLHYIQSVNN